MGESEPIGGKLTDVWMVRALGGLESSLQSRLGNETVPSLSCQIEA